MLRPGKIPSDSQIRKFIRHIIFGKNLFCPECHSRRVASSQGRYRCSSCRIRFSLLSHTWLANLKIPLRQFWLVTWCYTAQMPIKQASLVSELSLKAVRFWYDTFRSNLPENKVVLEHIVQLDEAYFGGWKGKALLLAKQKGTRKLAYKVLNHTDPSRLDAWDFLKENIKPGSMLCTDGFSIYEGIEKLYPVTHVVDIHKSWEFGKTSEIEGMFGNLRTFIRRMYHHVTPKNLPEVVSEFCFRFSHPETFENLRIFLTITLCLVPTGY